MKQGFMININARVVQGTCKRFVSVKAFMKNTCVSGNQTLPKFTGET